MVGAFAAGHTGFASSSCPLVIIGNFIVIPRVLPDEDNVVLGDRCLDLDEALPRILLILQINKAKINRTKKLTELINYSCTMC